MPNRAVIGIAALLVVCAFESAALAQFETRATFNLKPNVPYSVVVGDFNRDGNLDVAVVKYLPTGSVTILLGNGDGTFRTGPTYAVAVQPLFAATASFRRNGILDLVVGDSLSDDVYVMLGNGDGTFQLPVPYPTSGEPFVVSTGDFTGDGKLDIIALTQPAADCDCIEVLPGNGDGTFGAAIVTPVPYGIDGLTLTVGDFNGDKELDVAVAGQFGGANQVDILLGNGDGTFRADGFYDVSLSPNSIVAADFTGNHKLDLAVGVDPGVQILLGNGDGTFQQPVLYPTNFPTSIVAKDLNGDGRRDLVVSNAGISDPSGVTVLAGNGDGTFQPGVFYPAGNTLYYVTSEDFNNDSRPDLVAVDGVGFAVITLLNTGAAVFSPTTPLGSRGQLIGTTSSPMSVTLTNSGTAAMNISSVTCSGQPFRMTETTCKGSLAPGAQCSITADFTADKKGYASGTIILHDSASSKPQVVELVSSGTVVELSPTALTFAAQKVGTTSLTQKVQVTNIGSTALNFTHFIYIEGNDFNDFSESNNCGSQIGPGAGCAVSIKFSPHKTGNRTARLKITDNGGASPQLVPLTGTGD